nr:hypothetical protein [Chloroflexia bacterium]
MSDFFGWVILLPLAGACLALLAGKRVTPVVGVVTAMLTFGAVAGLAWDVWQLGQQ